MVVFIRPLYWSQLWLFILKLNLLSALFRTTTLLCINSQV